MAIKNRLKVILAEKNMSQNELAEKLSMSKATISNIVNGNQNATLETALDMSKILNVSVEDIFYKPKNQDEAFGGFIELIEQLDNMYELYELNKFSRKDIISIYKALMGNFIKEYDYDMIDLCIDAYTSDGSKLNPLAEKVLYGAE